jgi:predicted transporter
MSFGESAHWFFNTAGIGGIVVMTVILVAAGVYTFLIRWIMEDGEEASERPRRRIR